MAGILLRAFALTLTLGGCGSLDEPGTAGFDGSCSHPTYCDDYYGMPQRFVDMNRDRCPTVDRGVWSAAAPCSRAAVIGGCRYTLSGVPGERVEWYLAGWGSRETAEATCKGFGGTFVPADFTVPATP